MVSITHQTTLHNGSQSRSLHQSIDVTCNNYQSFVAVGDIHQCSDDNIQKVCIMAIDESAIRWKAIAVSNTAVIDLCRMHRRDVLAVMKRFYQDRSIISFCTCQLSPYKGVMNLCTHQISTWAYPYGVGDDSFPNILMSKRWGICVDDIKSIKRWRNNTCKGKDFT